MLQWLVSIHEHEPLAIPVLVGVGWSAGVAWGAFLWRRSEAQRAAEARVQRHLLHLQTQLRQYEQQGASGDRVD